MGSNRRLGIMLGLALGCSAMAGCKKANPPAPPPVVTNNGGTPFKPGGPGLIANLPSASLVTFDLSAAEMLKIPAVAQMRTLVMSRPQVKVAFEAMKSRCGFDPFDRVKDLAVAGMVPLAGEDKPAPAIVVHGTWTKDEAKKCLTALLAEGNTVESLPDVDGMGVLAFRRKFDTGMAMMRGMNGMPAMAGMVGPDASVEQMAALTAFADAGLPTMLTQPAERHPKRIGYGDGVMVFSFESVLPSVVAVASKKAPGGDTNAELTAGHSVLGENPLLAVVFDVRAFTKAFPEMVSVLTRKLERNQMMGQFVPVLANMQTVSFGGRMDAAGGMHGSFVIRAGNDADAKKIFDAVDGLWKIGKIALRGKISASKPRAEEGLNQMEAKMPEMKSQIAAIRNFMGMVDGLLDKIVVKQDASTVRIDVDFTAEETNGIFSTASAGTAFAMFALERRSEAAMIGIPNDMEPRTAVFANAPAGDASAASAQTAAEVDASTESDNDAAVAAPVN